MTLQKQLVIHLGYHKTGSSSIQKWLLDHSEKLSDELYCYNLANGSSNPLKFAVHSWLMRGQNQNGLEAKCREMVAEIRALTQKTVLITDESLLGMPLGFSSGDFTETGIYPRASEVVEVLAREFAEFTPVFVVFERDHESWLRSAHNQMHKQGCLTEDFKGYLARFQPQIDWLAMRDELRSGIGNNGSLVALNFEEEFAKPIVGDMHFFRLLNLTPAALARCRPGLEQVNPSVPLRRAAQPEKRQALVLGGSNSMIANGWVNLLVREYTNLAQITNLSVGACTTTMGLYRLLSRQGRTHGVPLIWEYGINEYNHLVSGQPLASLMYHLEWLLQLAIREDRPFVPLLMRSRKQALPGHSDAYLSSVTDLFHRYGLELVDANLLLHILARGQPDVALWYSDPAHYNTATEVPRRVSEAVLMALPNARIPRQIAERAAHFDALDLVLSTPAQPLSIFENSVMSCAFARFETSPRISVEGRALAAIIVTSGTGPDICLQAGDATLGIYATQVVYGPHIPARQLRQLVLGTLGLSVPGGEMQIRINDGKTPPMVQNMYTRGVPSPDVQENGLVAILVEKAR